MFAQKAVVCLELSLDFIRDPHLRQLSVHCISNGNEVWTTERSSVLALRGNSVWDLSLIVSQPPVAWFIRANQATYVTVASYNDLDEFFHVCSSLFSFSPFSLFSPHTCLTKRKRGGIGCKVWVQWFPETFVRRKFPSRVSWKVSLDILRASSKLC